MTVLVVNIINGGYPRLWLVTWCVHCITFVRWSGGEWSDCFYTCSIHLNSHVSFCWIDIISRVTSVGLGNRLYVGECYSHVQISRYYVPYDSGKLAASTAHIRMLWRKSSILGLHAVHFGRISECLAHRLITTLSARTVKDTKKHVSPLRRGYLEARFPLLLWLPTASDLTNHSQIALLSGRQGIRLNCITYERLRCKWLGDASTLQIRCIQGYGWAYVIPHLLSTTN